MRNLLFLNIETTGLDTEEKRILQLGMRLVTSDQVQNFHQRISPCNLSIPAVATEIHRTTDRVATIQGVSIHQGLELLMKQLRQAEIIIGHNIASAIAIILAEAHRTGRQDITELLSPPLFGFDGGERAAICTQQLSADYLRFLDELPSRSDTKLTTIYRRLFGHELPDDQELSARAIACQRVYDFLSSFKLEHESEFLADIVFFED
jgi:DNA polymerase III epsilon subunit-like protein